MLRRAAISLACVACAGCGWMFPDDRDVPDSVREMFAEMTGGMEPGVDCEVLLDEIREVASAPDPHGSGNDYSWFEAPTDSGGTWDFVFQLDPDGNTLGGGGGGGACEPPPSADEISWSGGGGSEFHVSHGGRVPQGSKTVHLYFGDNDEPVTVDVQGGGYFFVVLGESACCEFSFPDRIEAIDADGEVIATSRP